MKDEADLTVATYNNWWALEGKSFAFQVASTNGLIGLPAAARAERIALHAFFAGWAAALAPRTERAAAAEEGEGT